MNRKSYCWIKPTVAFYNTVAIFDRSTGKTVIASNGYVIDDTVEYVKNGSHTTNMPLSIKFIDKKYKFWNLLEKRLDFCC